MAKKTRKVLKQESQQRAIQQAAINVNSAMSAAVAQAAVVDKPVVTSRAAKIDDTTADDFRHVKLDLRRIGILAASFTAILVVLSFFIQ